MVASGLEEALGFGDLFRGHPDCNFVATCDRVLSRLTRRS
jgi:hypothetical protein|tara:strand:+ start:4590 stop:4709 length:120 start_codon:yes stop_codon:yes gene_type:complete